MKLRITKGRIALAVVLAPVLYVLNIGPLQYCINNFGLSERLVIYLYQPFWNACIKDTSLEPIWHNYVMWWANLPRTY